MIHLHLLKIRGKRFSRTSTTASHCMGWYTKPPSRGLSQHQRRCLVSGASPVTTLGALSTASMTLNTGCLGQTKAIRLQTLLSSATTTLDVSLLFNILTPGFTLP